MFVLGTLDLLRAKQSSPAKTKHVDTNIEFVCTNLRSAYFFYKKKASCVRMGQTRNGRQHVWSGHVNKLHDDDDELQKTEKSFKVEF